MHSSLPHREGRNGDRPTKPALAPLSPELRARETIGEPSLRPGAASGGARRARSASSVESIVAGMQSNPALRERIVHWKELEARAAVLEDLPSALDPRLARLLESRGLAQLYSHQRRAIDFALEGRDVLVTTSTASGKTLCYVVPVLQRLLETEGRARALFLFPTKALSQDQSASLNGLIGELGQPWHSFTYDGDTPPSVRRTLRDRGHILLTNPWMLHAGILPNHPKWSELFRDLSTIVIDEVHTLSGVFGSSVANVLRRLLRIAAHYGSKPRFLLSSATLRDPAEHARRLIGRDVALVTEDGSPAGKRSFALYNPPMLDPVAGLRANALEETRRLAHQVVGPSHQTIFFANRRTAVEVLTRYLKEAAHEFGLDPDEIRGYRGGYLPLHRREIEEGLRDGTVKVVVTTNALELGIDIGRLDVAVLVGYPGSQASFWQRAGRVGRRGHASLVVQVARSDAIDQYLTQHPEHLYGSPRERLGLDPDNLVILSEQVKCAAFELPFRKQELAADTPFARAPHVESVLDYLAGESGVLHEKAGTWYWMADAYPAQDVTLGGAGPDNVLVLDAETGVALGEIDRAASITTVHEGAIYQIEGETWKVERFDYANRRAYLKRVDSDYFTEAETDTEVCVLRLERVARRDRTDAERGEDYSVWTGEVHVTTLATPYKKVRVYTRDSVGAEDIHLPAEELDPQAAVVTLSAASASELLLDQGDRGAAWAGVGKLVRHVAPLFLRCQPSDLGLSSQVKSKHFRRPALVFYDKVQGGVGLSELFFESHREILDAALDVVTRCECTSGCPVCVGPPEEAGALGKATARKILEHLSSGTEPKEG
ncbi:MAG TPA: DEAD/DEAH box helicase, partial [Planctomycetota bacterium]|nr:DEAD/DEAH box helicase [Planctomycetota bacterium]